MNNGVNPIRLKARMQTQHILASLPDGNFTKQKVKDWNQKVSYYYEKFKYEYSIGQMNEARRSLSLAKIFAGYISGEYTRPEVANLLTLKD